MHRVSNISEIIIFQIWKSKYDWNWKLIRRWKQCQNYRDDWLLFFYCYFSHITLRSKSVTSPKHKQICVSHYPIFGVTESLRGDSVKSLRAHTAVFSKCCIYQQASIKYVTKNVETSWGLQWKSYPTHNSSYK